MKKLMIVAAVAMAAIVSNAGAVKWYSANNTMKSAAGASLGIGETFYVLYLGDTSLADFKTAFEAAKGNINDESLASYVIGSQNVDADYAKVGTLDAPAVETSTAFTPNQSYNVSLMYIDELTRTGDTENGSVKYQISEAHSMKAYDPDDAQAAAAATVYKFTSAKGQMGYTTASWSGGDVPEPTSAMLLLLGVAGLALRRKRA